MHGAFAGRPLTHGRYARAVRPEVRKLLEAALTDPETDSLEVEKGLARALFEDYLQRSKGGNAEENRAWLATIASIADKESRVTSRRSFDVRAAVALKLSIISILRDLLPPDKVEEFQRRFAQTWGVDWPDRALLEQPKAGPWSDVL
jgi:hypothetical protein